MPQWKKDAPGILFCLKVFMAEILNIHYTLSHAAISLDTGEEFELPVDAVGQFRLIRGKVLDKEEYHQLREESDRYSCRQKALSYLALRSRSAEEIRNYLRKKHFSADIIDETVNALANSGYVNDYEFSLKFIRYKTGRKATGQNLLKKELYAKGIEKSVINRALKESLSDIDDFEKAYIAARKKFLSLANKKNRMRRVYGFLHQRGFDSGFINKILDRLKNEGLKD